MDESVDQVATVEVDAAARWRDAGALICRINPGLFESMVRAAEVTAVELSTARKNNIG